MRLSFFTLAFLLCASPSLAAPDDSASDADGASVAQALTEAPQEERLPYWTIQLDPLTLALGYVHVQIEQRVTPYASLYVGPHLRLFSNPLAEPEPYLGFGLEAGVRIFPFGAAPTGPWVMLRGVAAQLVTLDDSAAPTVGGYISALGGYTWVFWDHFLLSGGLGAQYIHYRIGQYGPQTLFPALHTALGVAF